MKINWKVLVALVFAVATTYWAVNSVLPRSYSGTDLNFAVGTGPVALTNASDAPVSAQLVGLGSRSFSLVSTVEGLSGASTREGTGRTITQLFELAVPPGSSEFTIMRGTNVNFAAASDANLAVTVQPTDAAQSRTIIIVSGLVVLALLFYVSSTTGHRWLSAIRNRGTAAQVTPPVATATVSSDGGQGQALKAYGDNRAP